jgi:hypothetical protein
MISLFDLTESDIVHVTSYEESLYFSYVLDKFGFRWASGNSYKELNYWYYGRHYHCVKNNTTHSPVSNNMIYRLCDILECQLERNFKNILLND